MNTTATSSGKVIRNRDMLALKAYIQAQDATQYDNVDDGMVILDLSHSNLIQRHIEIRFYLHDTLNTLRQKIHQKTGTAPHFQHLQIKSAGTIFCEIPPEQPDDIKLGYFSLQHGMEVHCVDLNPHSGSAGGQYENVSLVKKFQLTDEQYDNRKGTLRDWEREQKAKDSTFTLAKHAKQHREMVDAQRQHRMGLPLPKGFDVDATGKVFRCDDDDNDNEFNNINAQNKQKYDDKELSLEEGPDSVQGIELNMRCQVEPGSRRGTVMFVGEVPSLGGYWVGIKFDEPVGKSDGSVKGKVYFEAMPKHGGFCRGKNVQVGDFPELDIFDELDSDSDDEDEL